MHSLLLERARTLSFRLPHLGVGHDLASLCVADLWGVVRFLQRFAGEQ